MKAVHYLLAKFLKLTVLNLSLGGRKYTHTYSDILLINA